MRKVNRCLNPRIGADAWSLVSNVGGGNAATRAVISDRTWIGPYSYAFTFSAWSAAGFAYVNWGESAAQNPAVTPGEVLYLRVRVWTTHADIQARANLQVQNAAYSGTVQSVNGAWSSGPANTWQVLTLGPVTMASGAAWARLQVELRTVGAGAVGNTLVISGMHFGPDVGDYLDGDMGPAYHWDGVPGRSTSYVDLPDPRTPVLRTQGALAVETALWLADRYGNKLERIAQRQPVTGTIQFNEDTATNRALSLTVNEPYLFEPFRDFVIPEITIADAYGTVITRDFGHYVVLPPKTTTEPQRVSGTIEGKGALEWMLSRSQLVTYTADAGRDTGEVAREIAMGIGVNPNQIQIPNTGKVLVEEYQPKPGIDRLQAMTDLLVASNHYAPWSTGTGELVSRPYQDIAVISPVRSWSTESGAQLVPPITEEPNWDRLRNHVVVRRIDPSKEPIWADVWITNQTHPLFHDPDNPEIGFPEELGEVVDSTEVETESEALALARSLLAEGASYYRKLTLRTLIDMDADAHEVIALTVMDGSRIAYDGSWWRRAWKVTLSGVSAITDSEIYRVEAWA